MNFPRTENFGTTSHIGFMSSMKMFKFICWVIPSETLPFCVINLERKKGCLSFWPYVCMTHDSFDHCLCKRMTSIFTGWINEGHFNGFFCLCHAVNRNRNSYLSRNIFHEKSLFHLKTPPAKMLVILFQSQCAKYHKNVLHGYKYDELHSEGPYWVIVAHLAFRVLLSQ